MEKLLYLILCIACAIFWRMGGAAGYDKLWRRIGSSACIFLPMLLCYNPLTYGHLIALGMVLWGSWSYFGWLTPGNPKEQWFNYLVAALMTQCSVLVVFSSWPRVAVAITVALLGALGKVLIDSDEDGTILMFGEDILSELYYGFIMCLGVVISVSI